MIFKFNLIFCVHQIIWRPHYNLHRKSISVNNIFDFFRVSKQNETFFTELSKNSPFPSLFISLPFCYFFFFGTTGYSCEPHFVLAVVDTVMIISNRNGHRFGWVHKANYFLCCLFSKLVLMAYIGDFHQISWSEWSSLGLLSQETTVMVSSAVNGVVGLLCIASDLPDIFFAIDNILPCPGSSAFLSHYSCFIIIIVIS